MIHVGIPDSKLYLGYRPSTIPFFPSKMRGTLLTAPFSFLYHPSPLSAEPQLCSKEGTTLHLSAELFTFQESQTLLSGILWGLWFCMIKRSIEFFFFFQIKRADSSLKWELLLSLDKKIAYVSLDYYLPKTEKSPILWLQQDRSLSLFQ